MTKSRKPKTVYVAMSGGVDSSVAALLLKQKGFNVVGVFMRPWNPPGFDCGWRKDQQDAQKVAATIGIPLKTWDFSEKFGDKVTGYMIDGYRRGITPNPDVMCNRDIKFGCFFKQAMKEGADLVATGHYARLARRGGRSYLAAAKDQNKDQTYFLWAVAPKCFEKTVFPIGGLLKPEVRKIAAQAGLVTATKKDSQGVCFVGQLDVKKFLTQAIPTKAGMIKHVDGRTIGQHDGAAYYTIGQRHGLDVKDGAGPYFIVSKDMRRNIIVVGDEKDLYSQEASLVRMNWFGPRLKKGSKVKVKIRYRTPAFPAVFDGRNGVVFTKPVRAITPGQSAVIYQGVRLVGGGVIT